MSTVVEAKGQTRLVWVWFRQVWAGRGRTLAIIVALSIVNALVVTAVPWLWQFVVDEIGGADTGRILELGLWIGLVGIVQSLIYMALQGSRTVMNARIQWAARQRLTDHIIDAQLAFFRVWRTGDLVTRVADDAGEKTSWFLCSGIFRALEAALIVLVCFGAMLTIDPALTLWVCLPLPLLIAGQALAQNALQPRFRAVQSAISDLNDDIASTFGGIRVVQGCGLEHAARRRFHVRASAQRQAEVRATVLQQAIYMMYGYGWQLAVVALLLAGGSRVLDGSLSLGQYVTFEGFLMTLVWPMFDFGMFVSRYKQAGVALERLEEVLTSARGEARADVSRLEREAEADAVAVNRKSQPDASVVPCADATLAMCVRGASVVAEDGALLLDSVELTAGLGSTVAVVGEVGAGKSTLMQLLAGARRPVEGTVQVGRVAPDDAPDVAYVPQDPVILSATVLENIALGREISYDALRRALDVSRLEQDLVQFPDGLQTIVGERGHTLSGGQQQRVALARALVGAPAILLLDDATAALDADTEAAFWARLREVRRDCAAVVVTHRVTTIERADEVLVLEHGRVVQRGKHGELVAQDGPYRRIYGRYRAEERLAQ